MPKGEKWMSKAILVAVMAIVLLPATAFARGPEVSAVTGSDIVLNDRGETELAEPGIAPAKSALKAFRGATARAAANATPALGTQKFWYSRSGNSLLRDRL